MSNPLEQRAPAPGVRLNRALATLPPELQDKWDEDHGDLPLEEQEVLMDAYMEKRKEVLARSFQDYEHQAEVPTTHEYPQELVDALAALERNDHRVVGEGQAARVITTTSENGLCFKMLFPKHSTPAGSNSIAHEVALQEQIWRLGTVAGVRVPEAYSFVESDTARIITMELLDAVSVRDVFIDRKEPCPDTFNPATFFEMLGAYITFLHENHYYHRDLHEGNVLIDRVTGEPRVIDFGYSARAFAEDEPYRVRRVINGQESEVVLPSDDVRVESMKRQVAAWRRV